MRRVLSSVSLEQIVCRSPAPTSRTLIVRAGMTATGVDVMLSATSVPTYVIVPFRQSTL